jgi:FkbM family methyltransferase
MKTAIANLIYKIESPYDIIKHRFNKLIYGKSKANDLKLKSFFEKFWRKYYIDNVWNFNGIKLPGLKNDTTITSIYPVYLDSLFVYCVHNDNYDCKLIDKLDEILPEGAYSYKKNNFDVTVKKNDIVIDAGAWIGDFSAYASKKGAFVYAFEPCKETISYLKITKELNGNIEIVPFGLGETKSIALLSHNEFSSANQITTDKDNSEKIDITTIDDFVSELKLEKVDFLKADIEGFERYMLMGAKETLKRFGPKLAICTYHLPDDPEVLSKIILDSNPNYTIIQKKKKLYAAII